MNETKKARNQKTLERHYQTYRQHLRDTDAFEPIACDCKLDRIVAAASVVPTAAIQNIPGFRLRRRYPVKPQRRGDFVPYGWAARIAGTGSIREVVIYSDRQAKWLAPAKIIVIARDALGLQFADACSVFELLSNPQLIDVEIALDFPINSLVDVAFVERHAIFGKSQPRNVGKNPLYSNYGTRVGSKFVRSYAKFEIQRHRVEPNFHRRDLKRFGIKDIFNLHTLADILPRHIFLAQLSRTKLEQNLHRQDFSIQKQQAILREAEKLERNLCRTLKYLRRTARLKNTRRLLSPLDDLNRVVLAAINKWAAEWAASYPGSTENIR
jgi:hypothetical protein